MLFGFLNIYKHRGMTSNAVIAVLRKSLKIRQIGFSGTLDPLAEGVLPVAVGKATKLIDYLNSDKSYIATAKFGMVSDTFDCEGVMTNLVDAPYITLNDLKQALEQFKGEIVQKPPIYSAVHVNGKRLYELARKNIADVEIPERTVFVSEIKLLEFDEVNQTAHILISCSKGTYVRSIVSDLGKSLNSGAVMTKLVRNYSSGFDISTSVFPENINIDNIYEYLIPVEDIVDGTVIDIDDLQFERVKYGNSVKIDIESDKLILIRYKNQIVGIGTIQNNLLTVKKVFIETY